MFPTDIYPTLSRYNRWMNEKLFAICAQLSDEQRKRDLQAPFGSIHGTWNHLLLTDCIWLARFAGEKFEFQTLADELYGDFDELRHERIKIDAAIDEFVNGLTPEKLNVTLRFTRHVAPDPPVEFAFPLWVGVQQLFNHQTHHRGQITTLLEQSGVDCGVTDFAKMPGLPTGE